MLFSSLLSGVCWLGDGRGHSAVDRVSFHVYAFISSNRTTIDEHQVCHRVKVWMTEWSAHYCLPCRDGDWLRQPILLKNGVVTCFICMNLDDDLTPQYP